MSQLQKSMLTCETGSVAPSSSAKKRKGVVQSQSMILARALADALNKASLTGGAVEVTHVIDAAVEFRRPSYKRDHSAESIILDCPSLTDFCDLGFQLYDSLMVRPLTFHRGKAAIGHLKSVNMIVGLVYSRLDSSRQLLFTSPEFPLVLQKALACCNSVGSIKNRQCSNGFAVNCFDISNAINAVVLPLLGNPDFEIQVGTLYAKSHKSEHETPSAKLKIHLAELIGAGMFEAHFRQATLSDKNRSLRQIFRSQKYKLNDHDWNSVRVEPLRGQFDLIASILMQDRVGI